MRTLIWSHSARHDLYQVAAYYGKITPSLALEMLDRVEKSPLILLDYPDIGSLTRRRGIRKWRVPKSPFLIYYATSQHYVEIRRVIHHATDIEWARA